MRTLILALFALVSISIGFQPASAQIQGQWTATASMSTPREDGALVALGKTSMLAVGGVDGSGNILATAELYTNATGKWKAAAGMASKIPARLSACALASGERPSSPCRGQWIQMFS